MALAREIPDSFVDAVAAHSADRASAVSLALAREQHAEYLSQLRKHVPTLCLPAIEAHPDCVFVEDTVVGVGDTAVITQPGHASRRGEVESIKTALQQLGMANIYDMRDEERATCDGGDVMFTGRHLFVGLSDRTNSEGFRFLRDAFMNHGLAEEDIVVVPPVVAGKSVLHLKSAVTHLDEQTLLVPEGNVGDSVLEAMKASERKYDAIRLPDVLSCNVVVVNGHVLAQDAPCEVSKRWIEDACNERDFGLTFVDTSELAKKDGALTCCSVLLSV
ncbi:hypothetical protein ACHAXT_002890 [Thalassiosira profunda]